MNGSLANDKAFCHYHDRHLRPLERNLENRRRDCWRELLLVRLPVSLVLLAAVAIVPVLSKGPGDDFWWWAYGLMVLLTALMLGIWSVLYWLTHREALKSEILPRLVPVFGDFRYEVAPKLDPRRYIDWAVLPTFDKSSSEEEVSGRHAGVGFRAFKLRLEERTLGAGCQRVRKGANGAEIPGFEYEIFKGLLMTMKISRPVNGTIVLGTRNMFRAEFGIWENTGLQKVFLEGMTLQAWASDPDAATLLLTPELLARIEAMTEELGIRKLRMGWHGDQIVMPVDFGRSLFELSQCETVDLFHDAKQVRDDLARITDMIDTLKNRSRGGADTEVAPLNEREKFDNVRVNGFDKGIEHAN